MTPNARSAERRARPLGALIAAWIAAPASAHLVSTELGPFYDGAAHPLVTPIDVLTIAVVALLASFGGAACGRSVVVSLVPGWMVGLVAGFSIAGGEWSAPIASAGALLVGGVAVAAGFAPRPILVAAVGGVLGVGRGLLNGSAALAADGVWLSLVGIASGVFVLAAVLAAASLAIERRGGAIALRVAGSWIAAIGLLLVGWQLRGTFTG